jgi:hypothetical protein
VTVLTGLLGMVGVLLAAGGASKLRQPAATVRSFGALGVRVPVGVVGAMAVGEVGLGLALVVVGGWWLAALGAAVFAGFTVITVRLLRLGDAATSCGCFGDRSAPPSVLHAIVDAGAAAVLAVGAAVDPPGLTGHWGSLPSGGFVMLGLMVLGGYLLVAMMTVFPDVLAAGRATSAEPGLFALHPAARR